MSSAFQTTRWTVIFKAGDSQSELGKVAFSQLCTDYWRPLYEFSRSVGASHEDAEDITQSFFHYLLENELPSGVHPTKGKFRTWLLAVFKNFVAADHRHQTRLKRGGSDLKGITVSLEEAEDEPELMDGVSPSLVYEREWARSVLANAMERLRVESEEAGHLERFTLLKDSLFDASKGEGATEQQAAALGISHNAAKIALTRLRQRYRELVRTEVSRLVEDPTEVDGELSYLVQVLSR